MDQNRHAGDREKIGGLAKVISNVHSLFLAGDLPLMLPTKAGVTENGVCFSQMPGISFLND